MKARGAPRLVSPALVVGAALLVAALAGWQSGCDRPEHALVEVQQSDCYTCHAAEYRATAAPPHAEAFAAVADPTACSQCHVTPDPTNPARMGWSPAVMPNHPFVLENAHAAAACADCHTIGYAPGETPNACVGCHLADYDASPHATQYSTECQNCHGTAGWLPASAHPESQFPIDGGPHSPFDCGDCHDATLGSYIDGANTDCVGCHTGEHTRASTDADHHEVSGYPAGDAPPNFCLACHPSGRN